MNKLTRLLILGASGATASYATAGQAADWNCKFTADRSATVDAAGAKKIVIGAGAGDLSVRGQDDQASLQASGRACASSEEILGKIQLESRREGDTVYLKTVFPEIGDAVFGFNRYATLDLTVVVPKSAVIALEDSSGDLELAGVQSAVVADSSGDMDISNVAGDLAVTDSSGDIEIEKIGGNLSVRDSSGDMEIEAIQGAVAIPVDSSGDIRVDDIGGNFTVGADGSGDIRHSKVAGTVQVPEE